MQVLGNYLLCLIIVTILCYIFIYVMLCSCAASIISKKAAEGLDVLVLDVKTGSGAFMKSMEQAFQLASILVNAINTIINMNVLSVFYQCIVDFFNFVLMTQCFFLSLTLLFC